MADGLFVFPESDRGRFSQVIRFSRSNNSNSEELNDAGAVLIMSGGRAQSSGSLSERRG